jgi:hypothetical protein
MTIPLRRVTSEGLIERGERRKVSLRGYIATEAGETSDALILDLSYDGCGIDTAIALVPGQAIKLSVPGRGAIQANVRWYDDGKAGLVFEPESGRPHRPRKSERMRLTAEVRLRRLGGTSFRVNVFDLSPEGCKVELLEVPREGDQMLIKFESLEILEAEVCWVDGHRGGLQFTRAIHPAVFDLLLARLSG